MKVVKTLKFRCHQVMKNGKMEKMKIWNCADEPTKEEIDQ